MDVHFHPFENELLNSPPGESYLAILKFLSSPFVESQHTVHHKESTAADLSFAWGRQPDCLHLELLSFAKSCTNKLAQGSLHEGSLDLIERALGMPEECAWRDEIFSFFTHISYESIGMRLRSPLLAIMLRKLDSRLTCKDTNRILSILVSYRECLPSEFWLSHLASRDKQRIMLVLEGLSLCNPDVINTAIHNESFEDFLPELAEIIAFMLPVFMQNMGGMKLTAIFKQDILPLFDENERALLLNEWKNLQFPLPAANDPEKNILFMLGYLGDPPDAIQLSRLRNELASRFITKPEEVIGIVHKITISVIDYCKGCDIVTPYLSRNRFGTNSYLDFNVKSMQERLLLYADPIFWLSERCYFIYSLPHDSRASVNIPERVGVKIELERSDAYCKACAKHGIKSNEFMSALLFTDSILAEWHSYS